MIRSYRDSTTRTMNDRENQLKAAIRTGLNIIGYKDNTEKMLREKLARRGYDCDVVEDAVGYLKSKGYLNEMKMLDSAVHSLALSKLYGKPRIIRELTAKGFSRDSISDYFASGEADDIDFFSICRKAFEKHGGETDRKTYAYLCRRGFGADEISRVFRERK